LIETQRSRVLHARNAAVHRRPAIETFGRGMNGVGRRSPNTASMRTRVTASGRLRPGWPLTALLVAYPLWWLLGVAEIFVLVAAALMAVELLHTHRIAVRRGFGLWLVFAAWLAIGVLLLQVNAPGAIPGSANTRYFTYSFRICMYLSATIVLLYIYNMRDRVSTTRVMRAFACLFVTVVAGGVLGTVAPHLDFPSALEVVLPHGLVHVQFVHDLVHPVVAQVHTVSGIENPRTSAPFAYTNDWGLAFACLLPFFMVAWLGPTAGWRRKAAVLVLLTSIFPVVESQNRGLWLALLASGLFIGIRAVAFGNIKFAFGLLAATAIVVSAVLSTPLGNTIAQRLSNSGSEASRGSLGAQTVASVTQGSPVVGLGTTRNVQGSFYSIAGGDTAACGGCSPPPLGTQGHFWLVIYSTGYGGLILYLGFTVFQFLRHLRLKSRTATVGLTVLAAHFSTLLVYDTIGIGLVIIFAAIGLLWREAAVESQVRTGLADLEPTIAGYFALLRANRSVVIACVLIGLMSGIAYQYFRGVESDAITTVVVPAEPRSAEADVDIETMDTIAQFVNAPLVRSAVERVTGHVVEPGDLRVTARANTRLLEIHFRDRDAQIVRQAAEAAGAALIQVRSQVLHAQAEDRLKTLSANRASLAAAVTKINDLRRKATPAVSSALLPIREQYLNRIETIDGNVAQISSAPADPGRIVSTSPADSESDAWLVAACSGLMLGFALSVLIAFTRHSISRQLGRRAVQSFAGLPVLGKVTPEDATTANGGARFASFDLGGVLTPDTDHGVALSADGRDATCTAASTMDRSSAPWPSDIGPAAMPAAVRLVAGPKTRVREVDLVRESLERSGAVVTGLIIADQVPRSRRGYRA
jgi:hypothetical protein